MKETREENKKKKTKIGELLTWGAGLFVAGAIGFYSYLSPAQIPAIGAGLDIKRRME